MNLLQNLHRTQWSALVILKIILLLPLQSWGQPDSSQVLPDDGIAWKFPDNPEGVVAIGDIHGDLDSLKQTLASQGLVNNKGHWIGGKKTLVQVGDLMDRGIEGRKVMDWLIMLEEEAKKAGGQVHVLLGNHEILVTKGDQYYAKTKAEDFASYSDIEVSARQKAIYQAQGLPESQWSHAAAFSADGKYGQWLSSKNQIIQIGDTLYVHAGLRNWAVTHDMGQINSTTRQWMQYYQKAAAGQAATMPPPATAWTIGYDANNRVINANGHHGFGPSFMYDASKPDDLNPHIGSIPEEELDAVLKKYSAKRVVVGHFVHEGGVSVLYNNRLYNIDVGMTPIYRQKMQQPPTSLLIQKDDVKIVTGEYGKHVIDIDFPKYRPLFEPVSSSRAGGFAELIRICFAGFKSAMAVFKGKK